MKLQQPNKKLNRYAKYVTELNKADDQRLADFIFLHPGNIEDKYMDSIYEAKIKLKNKLNASFLPTSADATKKLMDVSSATNNLIEKLKMFIKYLDDLTGVKGYYSNPCLFDKYFKVLYRPGKLARNVYVFYKYQLHPRDYTQYLQLVQIFRLAKDRESMWINYFKPSYKEAEGLKLGPFRQKIRGLLIDPYSDKVIYLHHSEILMSSEARLDAYQLWCTILFLEFVFRLAKTPKKFANILYDLGWHQDPLAFAHLDVVDYVFKLYTLTTNELKGQLQKSSLSSGGLSKEKLKTLLTLGTTDPIQSSLVLVGIDAKNK